MFFIMHQSDHLGWVGGRCFRSELTLPCPFEWIYQGDRIGVWKGDTRQVVRPTLYSFGPAAAV